MAYHVALSRPRRGFKSRTRRQDQRGRHSIAWSNIPPCGGGDSGSNPDRRPYGTSPHGVESACRAERRRFNSVRSDRGLVVQSGRTPPLRGGSRRFKSGRVHEAGWRSLAVLTGLITREIHGSNPCPAIRASGVAW